MFDPLGFLYLADELAIESARSNAATRAARIRTAYGRLYYGLFLAIREAIAFARQIPHMDFAPIAHLFTLR